MNKLDYFDETKEKKWNGPFYFIQGADIQFGFISRELENDAVINWNKECILAENLVERINQMSPRPRFFVMCGDLCDAMPDTDLKLRKQQEIDYKKIFGKLDKDIPLINVCGNHDIGNIPTSKTVQMFRSSFGRDYFSFWCGGILFLVINSQYFFDSSKVQDLAEEHSKWIDEKLEEAQRENMRIVVFQHIPWFLKSVDEEESYFTLKFNLRKEWLNKFKKAGVEAVFCGHYHRNGGGVYNGIDVVVTSAVGGQLGNDKPGARVVRVMDNKIEHTYFETMGETFNDNIVKELENLKKIIAKAKNGSKSGNEISINESQSSIFSSVNGHKSAHKEIKDEVVSNGKICGKFSQIVEVLKNKKEIPKSAIQTEVEIPCRGIHYIMKTGSDSEITHEKRNENNSEFKKARNNVDKINNFSEIKYSPYHMAEYIFWTGDEKGVASAIEEFLQEGLMSRQEAINFLQSVKNSLDIMQSRYEGLNKETLNINHKVLSKIKLPEKRKRNLSDERENAKLSLIDLSSVRSDSSEIMPTNKNLKQSFSLHQSNAPKTEFITRDYYVQRNKSYPKLPIISKTFEKGPEYYDYYDETAGSSKMTGPSQNEYSLEEVIFELAEIIFSESLTKGNSEAQKAAQKFSSFLQKKVKDGQISRKLQRKILGILSSALMNVISEHPEIMNISREEFQIIFNQISPTSEALRQLLLLGTQRLSEAMEVDQEVAKRLYLEGGIFICLGLPSGSEFGIDMKCITIGDKFSGVKMIPPGVHYMFYSVENNLGDQSSRVGFMHYFKKSEVIIMKWDSKKEELVDEKNEETIERLKANLKAMDKYLGAYPFDIWDRWKNLSSAITKNLVNKVIPLCGRIYSVLELKATSNKIKEENKTLKKPKMKLFLCDEKPDEILPHLEAAEGTEIRFSKIPDKSYPDNSTPSEITKHSLDSTYLFEQLLSQHENFSDILGEIQLSFVCFLIGFNFEAFEHWKKLIGIMCSCDEGISKHSEIFSKFITILNYELQEVQEDFLVDIVAGSNFVYKILQIFFRNLQCSDVNGRLKTKGKRFQELLTQKLKWDFSDILEEEEDDLPVVVNL